MTKPYALTLFSHNKPDTPEGIFSSMQMMGYGLWSEFSLLGHVTLLYHNTVDPRPIDPTDFSLVHECFDSPIYRRLPEMRTQTRHKIMGCMEIAFPSPLIDRAFTFLPVPEPRTEQIRLPLIRSIVDPTAVVPKVPGSILLDHGWLEKEVRTDWSDKLYGWLEVLQYSSRCPYSVAQLRRGRGCEEPPPWVRSIAEMPYTEYLAATAGFETFIVTHPGSYEHSILDMAARGIRVLVPTLDGRTFCHPSIVADLNLATFSNREELLSLLEHLPEPSPQDKFTNMSEVVAQLDAYCQEAIP